MGTLARYHAANLPELFEKISRNSIGMDDYLNRFWDSPTTQNYPPYNLVQVNNVESRLEIALAGFKKNEVKVYTELENYLSKASKKIKKQMENLSTKGSLKGHSNGLGRSLMIRKYDRSALKMDSYWFP